MNKVLGIFTAAALAGAIGGITCSGITWAADKDYPQGSQNPSAQTEQQGAPSDKPASEVADKANKPEEQKGDQDAYSAELKKCDLMSDASQKQRCIKKVQKDHGQM